MNIDTTEFDKIIAECYDYFLNKKAPEDDRALVLYCKNEKGMDMEEIVGTLSYYVGKKSAFRTKQ